VSCRRYRVLQSGGASSSQSASLVAFFSPVLSWSPVRLLCASPSDALSSPLPFLGSRHSHRPALYCLRALSPLPRGTFYLAFFYYFFLFFGAPPLRPRTSPSRFILNLSSLPSVGGVPIFPGSGNFSVTNYEVVSVRRPIGAEPAFPVRGMLAHFPHVFAGGRFPPSLRPPVSLFPAGRGQVALSYPPPPHT
jgi:hypothetical protein